MTPQEEVERLYWSIGEACHLCGKTIARRRDGAFFKHRGKDTPDTCLGSGVNPEVTLAKPLRAFLHEMRKFLHVLNTTSIQRGGSGDDVREWLLDGEQTGTELLRVLLAKAFVGRRAPTEAERAYGLSLVAEAEAALKARSDDENITRYAWAGE